MKSEVDNLKTLRREITFLKDCLHDKNVTLSALHYVWCSGGCVSGMNELHGEVTEKLVLAAEYNTKRLRTWWENKKFKERWKLMSQEERDEWFKAAKVRRNGS